VLIAGLGGYFLFLKALSYFTQPWYYLTLMALIAACAEGTLSLLARGAPGRIVTLLAAGVLIAAVAPSVWAVTLTRRTNLDLLASKVAESGASSDMIVVSPWYYGVTFQRYYHGKAPWVSIPVISEHRFHRYDLLKREMTRTDPMEPIRKSLQQTLRDGGRIWWIGTLEMPPEGSGPPTAPPAPGASWGWDDLPYYEVWTQQLGALFRAHTLRGGPVPVPVEESVNIYEDIPLYRLEGWRD